MPPHVLVFCMPRFFLLQKFAFEESGGLIVLVGESKTDVSKLFE